MRQPRPTTGPRLAITIVFVLLAAVWAMFAAMLLVSPAGLPGFVVLSASASLCVLAAWGWIEDYRWTGAVSAVALVASVLLSVLIGASLFAFFEWLRAIS